MFDWKLFEGWCELISDAAAIYIEGLSFNKDTFYRFDYRFDFSHDDKGDYCDERIILFNGDKCVSMTPKAFDKHFNKKYMNMMT